MYRLEVSPMGNTHQFLSSYRERHGLGHAALYVFIHGTIFVLEGLAGHPLEPLSRGRNFWPWRLSYWPSYPLLRGSGICWLSISPSCMDFGPGLVKVLLQPRLCLHSLGCFDLILIAASVNKWEVSPLGNNFDPILWFWRPFPPAQVWWWCAIYVNRMAQWHKSYQLFPLHRSWDIPCEGTILKVIIRSKV